MTRSLAPLIVTAAIAVASCGGGSGTDPIVCTAEYRFGLAVYVTDSVTGAPAASGARLVTDIGGVPVDTTLDFPTSFPAGRPDLDAQALAGAGERAGTYRVTVRKAGYRDWVRTGVVVTADVCHVRTTVLTALIQPITP
jgi:hypothetical protein